MTRFIGRRDHRHDSAGKLGVLLVNLGTPDAPTPWALRRYLKQFLWDRRVVEMPRPLWWVLLNGVILNVRPFLSARSYAKVWTAEGSPLLVISRQQERALAKALPGAQIVLAMRYGSPSISEAMRELHDHNTRRLLVLPLYPQYSATTTGSCFDAVADELRDWRWTPDVRFVNSYHDNPGYIAALADSIRQFWSEQERGQRLLFSFHGLPKRYLEEGDPYFCHAHKTARLLAEALGLANEQWQLVFQSRFGREEWLQPYCNQVLEQLPKDGVEAVDVVCPGFSADCLETLEEANMQNRERFIAAGGSRYQYIPCLNDSPRHIKFLVELINSVAQPAPGMPEDSLAQALALARQSGAQR